MLYTATLLRERLIVVSAGVTEATDLNEEMYGEERLTTFIAGQANRTAADIVKSIMHELARHALNTPSDNVTVVVVAADYIAPEEAATGAYS